MIGLQQPFAKGARDNCYRSKDNDGRNNKKAAQQYHLHCHRTARWICKLRQKREEEDRHLGIGDIHQDTTSVESQSIRRNSRLVGDTCRFGPKSLPCQIKEITSPDELEDRKRQRRGLKDSGHSESHSSSVKNQPRAQSQDHEQACDSAMERRLCQDEQVIRSWRRPKQDGGGKKMWQWSQWTAWNHLKASVAQSPALLQRTNRLLHGNAKNQRCSAFILAKIATSRIIRQWCLFLQGRNRGWPGSLASLACTSRSQMPRSAAPLRSLNL